MTLAEWSRSRKKIRFRHGIAIVSAVRRSIWCRCRLSSLRLNRIKFQPLKAKQSIGAVSTQSIACPAIKSLIQSARISCRICKTIHFNCSRHSTQPLAAAKVFYPYIPILRIHILSSNGYGVWKIMRLLKSQTKSIAWKSGIFASCRPAKCTQRFIRLPSHHIGYCGALIATKQSMPA